MFKSRRLFLFASAVLAPALCAAGTMPDIANGKATFSTNCAVCHSIQVKGGPAEGPNLRGLIGREAGSQPAFSKYSAALKASTLIWRTTVLDEFLANPMAMVPGTIMPLRIQDDKTRADVIAYLATLKQHDASDPPSPPSLPNG